MYKIAVCDDKKADRERACALTKQILPCSEPECFKTGLDLLSACERAPFEIVLMDVVLGTVNGIDVSEKLHALNPDIQIIFVSGSEEYMYTSYRVPHLWYIKKADLETLLPSALLRAAENAKRFATESIELRANGQNTVVLVRDVIYIEQKGRKVFVHVKTGAGASVLEAYGKISDYLTSNLLLQCHKSFAVNVHEAAAFTRTDITMTNGARVPISRGYYPNVRAFLMRADAEE